MRRESVAVAVILLIVACCAGVHLATTYEDYSRTNIQWNGTSVFFSLLEERGAEEVVDPAALAGYDDAVLLVIAPEGPPGPARINAVRDFLSRNTTVIICDDTGSGNALLEGLDLPLSIGGLNLSSVDTDYDTHTAVRGYPVGNHTATANVSAVLFNRPAAVTGGETLLQTSLLSWIDENGNGRIDGAEAVGRYPVAVTALSGGGEVIVVGDPGIFLNSMNGIGADNTRFIENILDLRPVVLVDTGWSRTATDGPLTLVVRTVKGYPLLQVVCAGLCIGAAAYYFRKRIHR
ncbi:DUF4350 domain-containing protein [Methanofollis fontis]|uniref:DUF4350 domain-containing protein n=1 Tax=Methanofollis fontis TaxID=2052832 RepID=A0A483CQB6_9EURY|nr:DUF4350 domain-containing protein [Methanofollis fontis]TAJ45315.1 hypothetical protein CUJ86_00780 [Methanofollis fontis]